jgi:hypothetical protein
MGKTAYLVCQMVKEMKIRDVYMPESTFTPIQMNWAEGMIGCMPVFRTKKAAKKCAGKKFQILKIEIGSFDA